MKGDRCEEGGPHDTIRWFPSTMSWRCERCGMRFSPHSELEDAHGAVETVRREMEMPHRHLIAKLRTLDLAEVAGVCGHTQDTIAAVYWGTYVAVRESAVDTVADLPPENEG